MAAKTGPLFRPREPQTHGCDMRANFLEIFSQSLRHDGSSTPAGRARPAHGQV